MEENNRGHSRRDFMKWAGTIGFGTVSVLAASACSSGGDKNDNAAGPTDEETPRGFSGGGGDKLKVGVIGPFSGVGAFVGRIVNNSLDAAVAQINATGGIGGRKVEVVKRDTGTDPAAGVKAYQSFSGDKNVIGVLWCGGLGLDESRAHIKRDNMPVISVFNDLFSVGQLYPDGGERSIFQIALPDKFTFQTILNYAKDDRGYKRIGFMYDSLLGGGAKDAFEKAMKSAGITAAGIETYQLNDGSFGAQINRLKQAKSEALFLWGIAASTAKIVKAIDNVGGGYSDTPTAKSAKWAPHIMGSPAGTGEHTWADLAGSSAKIGTITAWHVGGLVSLPSFAMRGWMTKYLKKGVTGGEESPADGLFTLLNAVKVSGSTDRQKIVDTIETMGDIKFASLPFGFTKDRHLAKTMDDMIIVTLERSTGAAKTDPPYQLGTEWTEVFPKGYVGPTHLVRPTLEANKRKHPEVMDEVVRLKYGSHCTAACKVH